MRGCTSPYRWRLVGALVAAVAAEWGNGSYQTASGQTTISRIKSHKGTGGGWEGKCQLHHGQWILRPGSESLFDGDACSADLFGGYFSCGRKQAEHGLGSWRWEPEAQLYHQCRMPDLRNITEISETLSSRRILFAGDSLNKVMFRALACLLRKHYEDFKLETVTKEVEPGSEETHAFARVTVRSLGLEVVNKMAPFLADGQQRLQEMPVWFSSMVEGFSARDILVLNVGKWMGRLAYPRDLRRRPNDPRPHVDVEDEFEAMRLIIRTASRYFKDTGFAGRIFWRTHTPSHYARDGSWMDSTCPATHPYSNDHKEPSMDEVDSFGAKAYATETSEVRVNTTWSLLDITRMAFLRPDGHPGDLVYTYNPSARGSDCTHFCLNGAVDPWIELLLHHIKHMD